MEYQEITNLLGNIPEKVLKFINNKWIDHLINLAMQMIDTNQANE